MKIVKRIGFCLLVGAICITAFGCRKKAPLSLPATYDQPSIPSYNTPSPKPVTYTPVYASSFGDTVILATVPVEEWHSLESDCPPREISNGGRIKCNGEHEEEVPITQVIILEDLIPRVCSGWFRDMVHLETIQGFDKLHTQEVSDMSYMFAGCVKLGTLELSAWDVSNVTDMTGMFEGCANLEIPDLSAWDVSNVQNMAEMFKDCDSMEILPEWYK